MVVYCTLYYHATVLEVDMFDQAPKLFDEVRVTLRRKHYSADVLVRIDE